MCLVCGADATQIFRMRHAPTRREYSCDDHARMFSGIAWVLEQRLHGVTIIDDEEA